MSTTEVMEESVQLRIGGLVLIFGLSVLSFASPMMYFQHLRNQKTFDGQPLDDVASMMKFQAIQESDRYRILKCISTGVILGVAILHLLHESIVEFSEISEYPFALLIAIIGLVIGLATDYVANYTIGDKEPCKLALENTSAESDVELAVVEKQQRDHQHDLDNRNHGYSDTTISQDKKSAANHTVTNPQHECVFHNPVAIKQKAVVKALMMEVAIAIHTVIIGFNFGTIDDIKEVSILMAALAFHQFFEGVSLGMACADASLSRLMTACCCLLFSLSWAVGVILGMFTTTQGDGVLVQAIFNALAAGLLMHTAIIEMIAEDFKLVGASDGKNGTKLWMLLALLLGIASMAILAIWS